LGQRLGKKKVVDRFFGASNLVVMTTQTIFKRNREDRQSTIDQMAEAGLKLVREDESQDEGSTILTFEKKQDDNRPGHVLAEKQVDEFLCGAVRRG